jgi:predicted alpha/beta superfamily hydrolase
MNNNANQGWPKIFQVIFFLLLQIVAMHSLYAQDTLQQKPLTIGRILTYPSKVLKEDRILNVYLPQGYDSSKPYPVIYVLDGSMNEDFLHITGLVQFFNLMFAMPESILVGIANVDRKRDFTFHTDRKDLKKQYPTTGHSALFIQCIEEEIQPFIQSQFKTNGTRYLIGQSLGGLLATEIFLKKPHLFTHYFVVSPSLWWDNESLLNDAKALLQQHKDRTEYLYLSVGLKESPIMINEAKRFYDLLMEDKGHQHKVVYQPMPEETHATVLHRSMYNALLNLFPSTEK